MIYGDAKKRNMIRSVLPSTARKSARTDLRNIKQRNRSFVNQSLKEICKGSFSADVVDNYEESAVDLNFYPNAEINWAVRERRDADKVQPLIAWAPHQVEGVRLEDRLSKLQALLPDNTIGRHAISHLKRTEAFEVPNVSDYWWAGKLRREAQAKERERSQWEYLEGCDRLMRVIESGLVKLFNDIPRMKKYVEVPPEEYWKYRRRIVWIRRDDGQMWPSSYGDSNYVYVADNWRHRPNGYRYARWVEGWSYGEIYRGYYRTETTARPLRGVHDIHDFIRQAIPETINEALKKVGM